MKCILCNRKGEIELQQGHLCEKCFPEYFQKKVYRTIRKYRLFSKDDVLCFALSGGKDSLAVAYVVSQIARKQKQRMFAIGVDEGVKNYREIQLEDMKRFCDGLGIEYHIFRFSDEYGKTNEEMMDIARKKGVDISQCTLCGILRRRILNREARNLGATKMVVGHNLDDEAQTSLMNLFKGSVDLMARLGPASGDSKHKGFIPRIKPLYFCTNEETAAFTRLKGIKVLYKACPHRKDSFREYVDKKIESIEKDYPGTKTSIIQNIIKIVPLIRKEYINSEIKVCRICGEPSRNSTCKSCDTLRKIGLIKA
ncbi:MAG: TIGR00269 family protein [Candidatus Aenigmarchaeota archaeon]|nr:TIGR00269 family protein [Candidatus Aenigmarchaeota archaeon]